MGLSLLIEQAASSLLIVQCGSFCLVNTVLSLDVEAGRWCPMKSNVWAALPEDGIPRVSAAVAVNVAPPPNPTLIKLQTRAFPAHL